MRQPASIYVRSMRRGVARLYARVERRVRKAAARAGGEVAGPAPARAIVDRETLRAAFRDLGLARGDAVLVHSGMSHLGKISGGARGVFELINEIVGENGHVLYPVFPFDTLMQTYLLSKPIFDVRSAPTKMGALTHFALNTSKGVRSVHPTHSVLAFGPRSANFVGEHQLCATPFADRSPFSRLVEARGKILLVGVGLNSTTSFHLTEDRLGDRFPVRVYGRETFRVACIDANGERCEVVTKSHDPFISRIRDCDIVKDDFLSTGVLRERAVGSGVVGLIDAVAMDRTLERLCLRNRKTIYGKIWG